MDELDSTEIGFTASETCGRCGMETTDSNGCCRDEFKVVKLETDQLVAKALLADFSLPLIIHTTTEFLLSPFRNYTPDQKLIAHSPPLLNEQETYLDNCVFRI